MCVDKRGAPTCMLILRQLGHRVTDDGVRSDLLQVQAPRRNEDRGLCVLRVTISCRWGGKENQSRQVTTALRQGRTWVRRREV